jgi:hypothetical protein
VVRQGRNVSRGSGLLRLAALALFGVIVLTAAGCQQPSAPSAPATVEVDHTAEGHKAFERQDWGTAASHYRIAIQQRPDDLLLHYRLAVATSWLDMRDEAMTEFEWVVAHAAAASEEARVARDWLAGARTQSVARAGGGGADADAAKDERVGDSGVHGRVVWDEGQGTQPLKRLQLHLYALSEDGTSKRMKFQVRTDFEGNYKFMKIPAGTYKMTDDNVGTPKWRLRVEVRPGEDALIDLGPDNSLKMRDDFPKSG